MQQTVSPQQLSGTIAAIPSKSWAHRELIAAALGAPDHAVLVRFRGGSNDIEATCRALRGLGAKIERLPGTGARVEGISRAELNTRTETPVLDCGESGTTLRYLLPVAAALSGPAGVIFTGSGRLPARPQEPLAGELERHGITLDYAEASPGALLPVRLTGRLLPGAYALSGAVSSQFLGGLLYALSVLDGPSTLAVKDRLESEPYVRMTLSALAESGVEIAESRTDQGLPLWTIAGRGVLTPPEDVQVEGDWSNAAFWLCAGALTQNPEGIAVEGLSLASLQGARAVVDILAQRAVSEPCGSNLRKTAPRFAGKRLMPGRFRTWCRFLPWRPAPPRAKLGSPMPNGSASKKAIGCRARLSSCICSASRMKSSPTDWWCTASAAHENFRAGAFQASKITALSWLPPWPAPPAAPP